MLNTIIKNNEANSFSVWKKELFPNLRFFDRDEKYAGKLYKKDVSLAFEYLNKAPKFTSDNYPNLQPPAKCNIIQISRPFNEWPISKVSESIQSYIYSLPFSELEVNVPGTKSSDQKEWFIKNNINNFNYTNVQSLISIFSNAKNTYLGVLKKIENKNIKNKKKIEKQNERNALNGRALISFIPEIGTNETGNLIHRPGINKNIFCNNGMKLSFINLNPDSILPLPVLKDRTQIQKGQPGYIPEWQRIPNDKNPGEKGFIAGLSQNKFKRIKFKSTKNKFRENLYPILMKISIGDDWVVFDIRGLLRSARFRKIIGKEITPNKLINLFTDSPIIMPELNVVQFLFKEGIVNINSKKITKKGFSKKLLTKLTETNSIGAVSIDLGQTNFVAAQIFRIKTNDDSLCSEKLESFLLLDTQISEFKKYKTKLDVLEAALKAEATTKLTEEQRIELHKAESVSAEETKLAICQELTIDPNDIPWDKISSGTKYISNIVKTKSEKIKNKIYYTKKEKGKTITEERRDGRWKADYTQFNDFVKNARKEREKYLWELKRNNQEYIKLAKWKKELTKNVVNFIIQKTKKRTQCDTIIVIIEDLNVSKMFTGSGTRQTGWEELFKPKKENRWFMRDFHKSISDLPINRGINVIEVDPRRTSITCPICENCDPENRVGEKFSCTKCGEQLNTDLDVAPHNIMRVALTGRPMPARGSVMSKAL